MQASKAGEGDDIVWHLSGPGGGGWIQSVAWDPQDPSTLYVGCDVGGFYVSFDEGRHFEIRNRGLHDYFIEAIAVHPRDNRIILLGTEGGHLSHNRPRQELAMDTERLPECPALGFLLSYRRRRSDRGEDIWETTSRTKFVACSLIMCRRARFCCA